MGVCDQKCSQSTVLEGATAMTDVVTIIAGLLHLSLSKRLRGEEAAQSLLSVIVLKFV